MWLVNWLAQIPSEEKVEVRTQEYILEEKGDPYKRERDGVLNSAGGVSLGQKELGEEATCMGTEADMFPGEIVEGGPP